MNEKLKELAKQAGEYVNSVYMAPARSSAPGKIWEDGHIGWSEQFNIKFAELIVKEMTGLMEQTIDDMYHCFEPSKRPTDFIDITQQWVDRFEKHFKN